MLKSPRPRARAVLVAAVLVAAALGLLVVVLTRSTIHLPPSALQRASALPATAPLAESRCDATRTRYLDVIEGLNHCTIDDACRGEACGGVFTDLDWCKSPFAAESPSFPLPTFILAEPAGSSRV